MPVRISWDKYESALLLYTYLLIEENAISRKQAIVFLSTILRNKAINSGVIIDDRYRNINGIAMQLANMSYVVSEGEKGLKCASAAFLKIFDVYQNDSSLYHHILEEGIKMSLLYPELSVHENILRMLEAEDIEYIDNTSKNGCLWVVGGPGLKDKLEKFSILGYHFTYKPGGGNSTHGCDAWWAKNDFMSQTEHTFTEHIGYINDFEVWLKSANVENVDEYLDAIKEVNGYSKKVYELEILYGNKEDIQEQLTILQRDQRYENDDYIFSSAMRKYKKFLKSICDVSINDDSDSVVDFESENNVEYTKASSVQIKNQVYDVRNWRDAYLTFVNWLLDNSPDVLMSFLNQNIGSRAGRSDLCNERDSNRMVAPKKIANDLYIELNLSAKNVIQKIKKLIDTSNLSYSDVIIKYGKKGNEHRIEQIDNNSSEQISFEFGERIDSFDDALVANCNSILKENFEDGYIIGNYMHQMRFISYYEETFGSSVDKEADELDKMLKSIGNVIEDRVFAVKNGEETMLLDDISLEINNLLDEGASCVYMECVYEKYASRLNSELNIYNSDTLTNVLRNKNKINTNYKFKSDRIANKIDDCQIDVKKVLQNSHVSISYDEINEMLWYIPIDAIKLALIHMDGAVWAGPGLYFYAPNFNISSEELSKLTAAMHSEIAAKGYLVTKDVVRLFSEKCPSAAIDYSGFKDYLIRNILKWKLSDQFSGSSAIFCEKGVEMDYDEMFRSFAANHSRLTLSEITEFQHEIDITRIYWNSIMKEMIRISPEELVNKENVHFDIAAIDSILDTMCPGDYEALKNIDIFISFPSIGYKWNGFVLESYLRDYSKLFRLEQMSISSDEFNGVMVRRSSPLKEYNDIAADMLAHNDSWNDEKSALRCLVNEGFQQRAANKKIGEIITKAKHIRENNS